MSNEKVRIFGWVEAVLTDTNGNTLGFWGQKNLVTDIGDQCIAKQLYSSASLPAAMKLGTSATAAAKNSTGSFTGTGDYISGSAQAFDSTYPKAGASANVSQYKVTYAAGTATNTNINSVSLTTDATDAFDDAAHTIARAVFSGAINKGASDTLTVTWNITILGA